MVGDEDLVAGRDRGVDDQLSEFVFEILLNGAFERTGAIVGVVALFGNEVLGLVSDCQCVAKFFDTLVEACQLDVYDLEDSLF